MPGLVIDNKEELVPGLEIINYHDQRLLKLKAGEDMRARHTRWIRSIVWHNTKNIATTQKDGIGPDTDLADRISRLWTKDPSHAGAHLSVDWNGVVCCHADLLQDAAYHASSMNEVSIGGELYEDKNGVVYEGQMEVAARLTEWLCCRFGIQKQMPDPNFNGEIARIKAGGKDCVGVFGHCHQYGGKKNDPGIHIFLALLRAGFKVFNFNKNEDKDYWLFMQKALEIESDGIPGPSTCDALRAKGFSNGLYDWSGDL